MSWIGKNAYLSSNERDNNAKIIYNELTTLGWSLNAICAVLGNMYKESTINPNIWENLTVNTERGYGVVQWTPATKLIEWCDSVGKDYTSGDAQIERIEWEKNNGAQWGKNNYASDYGYSTSPPITFAQFSTSNLSVDELTNYFVLYYERPAKKYYESSLQERKDSANYYYNLFSGEITEYKVSIKPKIIYGEEGSEIQFNATVIVPSGVSSEVTWEIISGVGVDNLGDGKFFVNNLLTNVKIRCTLNLDTTVFDTATISYTPIKKKKKMPVWLYLRKL